jgi:uncharacterized protein YgiM (DUF1202 family)
VIVSLDYDLSIVRRISCVLILAAALRCASPAPPVSPPAVPPPAPMPVEEKIIGTVRVTASALNVRSSATADAEVVAQLKKGEKLFVLSSDESWTRVKLNTGQTGWVASRFVVSDTAAASSSKKAKARKGGCAADSDFAFVETPQLRFSDSSAHGIVVVDATVNIGGNVVATKLISNTTGDPALAELAKVEIAKAKFSAPIRDCQPRAFIFTYRRTF